MAKYSADAIHSITIKHYILECIIWYIESFESQYERLPRHLKHPLVRTARKQNRRWDENLRDNFQPIPLQTIANMLDWIDLWSNIMKSRMLMILKWRDFCHFRISSLRFKRRVLHMFQLMKTCMWRFEYDNKCIVMMYSL